MFHKVLQTFLKCHKVLQKFQQLETVLLILIYCRTKYNMSGGDVEPCPTSNDFVEWRLTGNISISIMLFFVELRASKNITLSNQQNISFSNQRNRTICPCPLSVPKQQHSKDLLKSGHTGAQQNLLPVLWVYLMPCVLLETHKFRGGGKIYLWCTRLCVSFKQLPRLSSEN